MNGIFSWGYAVLIMILALFAFGAFVGFACYIGDIAGKWIANRNNKNK